MPGAQSARNVSNHAAFICGKSTASTIRCVVAARDIADAIPASGPASAMLSHTTSMSAGTHVCSGRADKYLCVTFSSSRSAHCRFQSSLPSKRSNALSTPMRTERPPANNTALKVSDDFTTLSFRASGRWQIRRASSGIDCHCEGGVADCGNPRIRKRV